MWWLLVIPVIVAIFYAYTISSSIKVAAPKEGCSSCDKKETDPTPWM